MYLLLLHFEETETFVTKPNVGLCDVLARTSQPHGGLNIPKSLKLTQKCLSGFAKEKARMLAVRLRFKMLWETNTLFSPRQSAFFSENPQGWTLGRDEAGLISYPHQPYRFSRNEELNLKFTEVSVRSIF